MTDITEAPTKNDLIYNFLREHPGESFMPVRLARALGLSAKQVTNGLTQLKVRPALRPGVVHDDDGWKYVDMPAQRDSVGCLQVTIPLEQWEQTGDTDPSSRLSASLVLNGVHMHVEARAVVWVDGEQTPQGDWPEDLDHLYEIGNPGNPFDTVTIMGREYVLLAFPHS